MDGDVRLTWESLWSRVLDSAHTLVRKGVGRGDVVSTQLPNGIDIVVLHLATELVGAIHNPLAIQFREHELNQIDDLMRPVLVVHPGDLDGRDYSTIHARTNAGSDGRAIEVASLSGGTSPTPSQAAPSARPDASSAAFILNTSGTVSIKGVVHSHEDAMFSTRVVSELIGLSSDDTIVCAIPMTWGGGLVWGLRIALDLGAKLVSLPRWDPVVAAEMIDREGGTYIYGPPTLAQDLVHLSEHWRPQHPLKMICAGAPIPRELCKKARGELGISLFPGYGQTEHLHSTVGRVGDSDEQLTRTDGSPLPGVEVRALGKDGEVSEPGEFGDLQCRGPNVAQGYFNQPELSAETFRDDGWQMTYDVGSLGRDGYLRVAGRKRDIIIRGGLNISPREVEALLVRHPDVRDAAVVGYSDPRYGERICAFIVPSRGHVPSVQEFAAALSDLGVARFKYPERVEEIDSLPLTTTGKVRHETLREILRQAQVGGNGDPSG